MRTRGWLSFHYEAEYSLDAGNPNWAPTVLKEVRLPRWTYEGHDRGAAFFVRASTKSPDGPLEARLRIGPDRPLPDITLDVAIQGRWTEDDARRRPPEHIADVLEEAEALLVLLGCRGARLFFARTERTR